MPKKGSNANTANPTLSRAGEVRAGNFTTSRNTPISSQQVDQPNRLAVVPDKNPSGQAPANTLGRQPLPLPPKSPPNALRFKKNL